MPNVRVQIIRRVLAALFARAQPAGNESLAYCWHDYRGRKLGGVVGDRPSVIWGLRCWATVPRGWVISCMNITTQRPSKILCGHFVRIS